jgi:hypothetical protein
VPFSNLRWLQDREINTISTPVLKIGTIFLTSALRKTEAPPRSVEQLPLLREMNRINRHFVYISIDTTYNKFPYMTVFVKRWFITIFNANVNLSCSVKVGTKLLNIETPVTRNFIRQILLNVQDFYFHKVGYTSYDEGIFGHYTGLTIFTTMRISKFSCVLIS